MKAIDTTVAIVYIATYIRRYVLGVKQYGSSLYCILSSSVLQYIVILQYTVWLDFVKNHFMGTSYAQLHMFCVANKSRESETSTYYNLYAFVCHFIFQSAKNDTISSNVLQYIAICNILIFSIGHIVLYCSSKYCNISIYRYIVSPLVCMYVYYCIATYNLYSYVCTCIYICSYIPKHAIKSFSPIEFIQGWYLLLIFSNNLWPEEVGHALCAAKNNFI